MVYFPAIDRLNSLRRNSSFQALTNNSIGRKKDRGGIEADEKFKKRIVSKRELVDNLKQIVVSYSKYRHAGVMETEASIKAVQVLIAQGNILYAAEFLQNVVFINLNMSDEEKVHRFSALSKLYSRLGFKRKSAFFNRVAAMRCVAPQNPNTDWNSCYNLLLKTLPGYNISFQTPSCDSNSVGWPALQVQVRHDL